MAALKSWQRGTLIVVLAGLAVGVQAWIACTDPAINICLIIEVQWHKLVTWLQPRDNSGM